MKEPAAPVTCALCGTSAAEPTLTWIRSVERGVEKLYCDQCSRTYLRSMESRLDADWFENGTM